MKLYQKMLQRVMEDFSALCGLSIPFIFTAFFFLIGELKIAQGLFFGLVLCMLITLLIRILYFKERPNRREKKSFLEKIDASSFPSLHAMRAWFLATFFAVVFQNAAVTLFLICIALIICYSRIYLKHHDWIDVMFGAMFGLGIGAILFYFF